MKLTTASPLVVEMRERLGSARGAPDSELACMILDGGRLRDSREVVGGAEALRLRVRFAGGKDGESRPGCMGCESGTPRRGNMHEEPTDIPETVYAYPCTALPVTT